MIDHFFTLLNFIDDAIWSYVGIPLIIGFGFYLSIHFKFPQITGFPRIISLFARLARKQTDEERGVHPLHAFFASIGGAIGLGNVVAVCTAVQIGGPGAIFWMWVAGLIGMLVKYSEIYLGLKYRIQNEQGGYNGGPMYFLQHAYKFTWIPKLVCLLFCIYGVEVYMFRIVTESIALNFAINKFIVLAVLLTLILIAVRGGVERVGKICTAILPIFILVYFCMNSWILLQHLNEIPAALMDIFTGAFNGHAATGAFTGSTMLVAMSQGVRRACYTGDIGVGYASIVHSESSMKNPAQQASLGIFGIFLDTFIICTLTILVILITGMWCTNIDASQVVQATLELYFPYMNYFMPVFFFLLGYSSMITFFVAGIKCARFAFGEKGVSFYYVYAVIAFVVCSFVGTQEALTIMSVSGACLLMVNLIGIVLLRKEVKADW
ncbi:MAG: sodium/alanine symporter protein [Waddliaceae bacterium]|nr:sodium/alanine symporter protein [Waddliaceae bacterium]